MKKILKKAYQNKKSQKLISKYNIKKEYLHINRQMVANAVFIGLFISFIPFPAQMLSVVGMMVFKKFNVPIALALCWVTNPFTIPFIYYIEYLTGSFFLGSQISNAPISFEWITSNFDNIFIPLYFGAFFYSTLFATIGYFLTNYLWKKSVYKNKKLHYTNR